MEAGERAEAMVKDGAQSKHPPRPTERPLDDGVRYGSETWREIDGVAFCHWDRWLLRLALAEQGGLDAIERELRARTSISLATPQGSMGSCATSSSSRCGRTTGC